MADLPLGASKASSMGQDSSSDAPKSEGRSVRLLRPSNRPFNARAVINAIPESFYNATGSDVRQAYNTLQSKTRTLDDAPLLTRKQRAAEEQKRMARFPHTIIRFLFPDRYSLEAVFTPSDNVRDLVKFLRGCIKGEGKDIKFVLFVTPPKKILRDGKSTLWKEGFAPAALVHVGIEQGPQQTQSIVRQDIWDKVESAPVPKEVEKPMPGPGKKLEGGASSKGKLKEAVQSGKKAAGKVIPSWLVKGLKK